MRWPRPLLRDDLPSSNLKMLKKRDLSGLTAQKKSSFPSNLTRPGKTTTQCEMQAPEPKFIWDSQSFRPKIGVRKTLICDDTCNKGSLHSLLELLSK